VDCGSGGGNLLIPAPQAQRVGIKK